MKIRYLLLAAMLASGAAVPLVTFGGANEDVAKMIVDAKARADHESLAEYYATEASALLVKAEKHREMSAAYGQVDYGKGGTGAMARHCGNLESSYRTAAAENESLARTHQELAGGSAG